MKKSQKEKVVKGAEIGGAITAAILAASAGAYLLADKRNKEKVKSWARKARVEVARKAKAAKRLGEAQYKTIVDRAVKRYGSLDNVNARELVAVARDLKARWDAIQKDARRIANERSRARTAKTSSRRTSTAAKKTTAKRRTKKTK